MCRSGWHSLSVEYYRGDTAEPLPTLTLSMRSSPDDADAAFWPIDTQLLRVWPLSTTPCTNSYSITQHAARCSCSE